MTILLKTQWLTARGSIVAVHGIAAAPDWTWITNNVHWLRDHDMLPAVIPNTRILQFGYESQWLNRRFVKHRLSLIARELLLRLEDQRQVGQSQKQNYLLSSLIY